MLMFSGISQMPTNIFEKVRKYQKIIFEQLQKLEKFKKNVKNYTLENPFELGVRQNRNDKPKGDAAAIPPFSGVLCFVPGIFTGCS